MRVADYLKQCSCRQTRICLRIDLHALWLGHVSDSHSTQTARSFVALSIQYVAYQS